MALRVVTLLLVAASANSLAGQERLFDENPQHPWNRLHQFFHVRTALDDARYDHEGLEPPIVPRSAFATTGDSHDEAIRLLDEFLAVDAAGRLVRDPEKRAVMQRDLWAIFWTTADPRLPHQSQRRELQWRLAAAMRRIALTRDEIDHLPDNLAAAIESGNLPTRFDSEHPDRPFLPDDLLQAEGTWTPLRHRFRDDGLAAPSHFDAVGGRASFQILLRLPDGRAATRKYLDRLEPLEIGRDEIPQFPAGTQVALVRRMFLIDDTATLRASPLVESVQLRVYQKLTTPDMYEIRLRRQALISGQAGGLAPTKADESDLFDLGVMGLSPRHQLDPLENEIHDRRCPIVVLQSCVACHAGPGIFGFQSVFAGHYDQPPLIAGDLSQADAATLAKSTSLYPWGLLQGLWHSTAAP